MPTLAAIRPIPPLLIAEHFLGACHVAVFLHVRAAGARLTATLTAAHTDPEGSFIETIDAAPALAAKGEDELFCYLESTAFPSGLLANPNRYDALVVHAGALF